jgi:hypothetical protein
MNRTLQERDSDFVLFVSLVGAARSELRDRLRSLSSRGSSARFFCGLTSRGPTYEAVMGLAEIAPGAM